MPDHLGMFNGALAGAGAVGDGDFGNGQHGEDAVGKAETEEHAL